MLTFNELIDPLTFTAADVRINGGSPGAGVVGVQQLSDPRQFLVWMNAPATGALSVTIGPEISDLFGNQMDQNQNGIEGEASDYYSTTRFPTGNLWTTGTELTTSPTKPIKGKLPVLAVDAYFRTY